MALNEKHKEFCRLYVLTKDVVKATEGAGYSIKGGASQGSRLLARDDIKREINRLRDKADNKVIKELQKSWTSSKTIHEAIELYELAVEKNQLSAATKVLQLIGKTNGAFPDKIEVNNKDKDQPVQVEFKIVNAKDSK